MSKKIVAMVSLYQSGEWIENRLDNLLQSTIESELDVWCVNANSPDERDDIIPQKFPVHYIKLLERVPVYSVWNIIIKSSSSKYLTAANSDDLVSPTAYEKLIDQLDNRRNQKYGFAYPSWHTTELANQKWGELKEYDSEGNPGHYHGDLDKSGVGHFPIWRRDLHNKYGLFDERFKALGDADWWARCYYCGNVKFLWVNEHLACYLWRGNSSNPNLWHREVNHNEWELYHANLECYKNTIK